MTPKLLRKYYKAYEARIQDQMIVLDTTNHILGGYIRTAIGDALSGKSKYPSEPRLKASLEEQKSSQMSDAEMIRIAQRNTAIIAGRLKKGNDT